MSHLTKCHAAAVHHEDDWPETRTQLQRGGISNNNLAYLHANFKPNPPHLCSGDLMIALVAPSLHPAAREIRLAAVLLGAPDVQASEASALAVQENCPDGQVSYFRSE